MTEEWDRDKERIKQLALRESSVCLSDAQLEELVQEIRDQGMAITIATIIEAAAILWALKL